MARLADIVRVPVSGGELRVLRVVEGRIRPRSRVVAVLASCREKLRLRRVSRVGSLVIVGLVATDASGRQSCVVIVDVAIGALSRRRLMRSRQREGRIVVIERRVGPHRRVVAQLASRREASRRMRGTIGLRIVGLMA